MWVIPESASGMGSREVEIVGEGFARRYHKKTVVRASRRRDMQPVIVQIGGLGQAVTEPDADVIAWMSIHNGTWKLSIEAIEV